MSLFKVKAKYLLLIAAAVWFIAGANIVRLGVLAIAEGTTPLYVLLIGIPVIFILFYLMFSKLVAKHTQRIRSYGEDKMHVLKFFDIKGYIIMIIMMTGGIALRSFGIVPNWFVAFFYTGLGSALMLAGIKFFLRFLNHGGNLHCPFTKKCHLS